MSETVQFTGTHVVAFGLQIAATCIVRNEINGWRQPHQVVRTMGQTVPHDLPYQPRQVPPGEHLITRVEPMRDSTEYWPFYIDTDAIQILPVWRLRNGTYGEPTDETFEGKGYGIHHARFRQDGELVPSNTTLGCINIIDPADASWLAGQIEQEWTAGGDVRLLVPPWEEWE